MGRGKEYHLPEDFEVFKELVLRCGGSSYVKDCFKLYTEKEDIEQLTRYRYKDWPADEEWSTKARGKEIVFGQYDGMFGKHFYCWDEWSGKYVTYCFHREMMEYDSMEELLSDNIYNEDKTGIRNGNIGFPEEYQKFYAKHSDYRGHMDDVYLCDEANAQTATYDYFIHSGRATYKGEKFIYLGFNCCKEKPDSYCSPERKTSFYDYGTGKYLRLWGWGWDEREYFDSPEEWFAAIEADSAEYYAKYDYIGELPEDYKEFFRKRGNEEFYNKKLHLVCDRKDILRLTSDEEEWIENENAWIRNGEEWNGNEDAWIRNGKEWNGASRRAVLGDGPREEDYHYHVLYNFDSGRYEWIRVEYDVDEVRYYFEIEEYDTIEKLLEDKQLCSDGKFVDSYGESAEDEYEDDDKYKDDDEYGENKDNNEYGENGDDDGHGEDDDDDWYAEDDDDKYDDVLRFYIEENIGGAGVRYVGPGGDAPEFRGEIEACSRALAAEQFPEIPEEYADFLAEYTNGFAQMSFEFFGTKPQEKASKHILPDIVSFNREWRREKGEKATHRLALGHNGSLICCYNEETGGYEEIYCLSSMKPEWKVLVEDEYDSFRELFISSHCGFEVGEFQYLLDMSYLKGGLVAEYAGENEVETCNLALAKAGLPELPEDYEHFLYCYANGSTWTGLEFFGTDAVGAEVGYVLGTAGVESGVMGTAGVESGVMGTAGVESGVMGAAGVESGASGAVCAYEKDGGAQIEDIVSFNKRWHETADPKYQEYLVLGRTKEVLLCYNAKEDWFEKLDIHTLERKHEKKFDTGYVKFEDLFEYNFKVDIFK